MATLTDVPAPRSPRSTRTRRTTRTNMEMIGWLFMRLSGVVLLVPWPFIMVGAIGR